jgi:hypothetical protein
MGLTAGRQAGETFSPPAPRKRISIKNLPKEDSKTKGLSQRSSDSREKLMTVASQVTGTGAFPEPLL